MTVIKIAIGVELFDTREANECMRALRDALAPYMRRTRNLKLTTTMALEIAETLISAGGDLASAAERLSRGTLLEQLTAAHLRLHIRTLVSEPPVPDALTLAQLDASDGEYHPEPADDEMSASERDAEDALREMREQDAIDELAAVAAQSAEPDEPANVIDLGERRRRRSAAGAAVQSVEQL